MQQTQSFLQLDQSQQSVIQTLADAIKDSRNQFEAIVERHAVEIEDVIKSQHERTRTLNIEHAEAIQNLVTTNHQKVLAHDAENQSSTRNIILRESAQVVAAIDSCQIQTAQHVDARTGDQAKTISSNLAAAQDSMQRHVTATSTATIQDISDAVEIQQFLNSVEVETMGLQTVNKISQQLRQAQLQIQELRNLQIRANSAVGSVRHTAQSRTRVSGGATADLPQTAPMLAGINSLLETIDEDFAKNMRKEPSRFCEDPKQWPSVTVDSRGFGSALVLRVRRDFQTAHRES